jgi:hypothetical protein
VPSKIHTNGIEAVSSMSFRSIPAVRGGDVYVGTQLKVCEEFRGNFCSEWCAQ